MRQLIVIGVPISGTMLLEWGLFSSAAMLVGWIGTTALAAHQIALQIAAILFMVPFGISMAATVRVGHAVGRGDPVATRRAGFAAHGARRRHHGRADADRRRVPRTSFRCSSSATPPRQPARPRGSPASLLLIGATWFVADGIQGIAAGALRGLNDTRVPMLYAALSFWVVGFTSAYALAFWFGLGVVRRLDRLFARRCGCSRCC